MKKIIFMFIMILGVNFFLLIDVFAAAKLTCDYKGDNASIYINFTEMGLNVTSISVYNLTNASHIVDSDAFINKLTSCPQVIYYSCKKGNPNTCLVNSNNLPSSDINGSVSLNEKTISGTNKINFGDSIFGGNNAVGNCVGYFGSANTEGDLMYILAHDVFKPIKILVPIVLVLLTSFDFAQAVFSDKKEGIPKATTNFLKRAIVAILIFFTPNILSLILTIIDAGAIKECLSNF